ncbi:Ferredoxin subunit of nitrite reductase or a ring-hydroxylating dioxygenase [Actinomadura meyerae]|uniref:Ferredoxin subunit of nitrite reductase or a ring-hydroxylating dioxygenase n=1 Tax=Actinomadura meyerae TaxID=240840 RepID=A0A239FC95_9ACTN|nr:Rieske 2Fe-2S domain-containing protein [Actinomadura meyerae]SNS53933.1 Ferredoxin subunit of nitrite reductase or a ring-hydroxylating dioxygenase [Actinomadura meyerae]
MIVMRMPQKMVHRLERAKSLDGAAKPVAKLVQKAVRPRPVRNTLSGTNLGHPLHPTLSDVPIGAWTMAGLLDAVGGCDAEPSADLLVGTGIAASVPTALSGLNDWSDTLGEERRVGFVHALSNSVALSLYIASLVMRMKGDRRAGKALGYAGLGMMSVGAYLGGHLSFAQGVNVNRHAWEHGPEEWTPVLGEHELAEGQHRTAEVGGVEILLHRMDGKVYAIDSVCSHMGGPLDEGTFEQGCVTCPWHGSTFRFSDGGIVRGPASMPQPSYETRIENGRIEVRMPPVGVPAGPAEEHGTKAGRRRQPAHSAAF